MARFEFGAGTADFVVAPSDGLWAVGAVTQLTFWSAATDGTQYTDLLDRQGQGIDSIVSDEYGAVPRFFGPDNITGMWADAGGTKRAWMDAHSITGLVPGEQAVETVNNVAPDGMGNVQLTPADLGIYVQETEPTAPTTGDVWMW
ncbi:hypothetical protein [Streptomyces sp. NPDC057428]|uniref:hypothetical protein n=1 Tax=Streptomyces sp. NPDC057428 TaxID=3346129 RepID=UPI0036B43A02